MSDNVTVNIKYGEKRLIDRQYGTLSTGDPTADMIIADLTKRLNASADEVERLSHTLLQVQGERDAAYNNGFLKAEGMLSTLGPEAVWKEADRIRALGEKP